MSLFLFTNALSSALGEALSPVIVDPHLIWVWAGPAIALAILTVIFYWRYRGMDDDEFMTEGKGDDTTAGINDHAIDLDTSDEASREVDEKKV